MPSAAYRALPLAALLLTGCSAYQAPPTQPPQQPESGCNAASVTDFQGLSADERTIELAREQSGSDRARVIAPNTHVTLEYDSQRLNINVDTGNTITSVSCG